MSVEISIAMGEISDNEQILMIYSYRTDIGDYSQMWLSLLTSGDFPSY